MSFEQVEKSRAEGEPVTLYEFIYDGVASDPPASLATFSYTDAEQEITHDSITYAPIPIRAGAITSSGSLDKQALTIRMPRDAELMDLAIVWPPAQIITLIIRQGHLSDPTNDFKVVWSGRVLSIGREEDECVATAEPISSSLRRPGLRRHWQIGCPHALYFGLCGASEAAATETATVTVISGTTISLAAGWQGARDPQKFLEGMVKWTDSVGGTQARKILKVSGDDLTLGGFLRDLSVSDSVSVILGCNHLLDDCEFLHVVIHDFGGGPWIPTENPVAHFNRFY